MRFAVCDDDKEVLNGMKSIINTYAKTRRFEAEIDYFHSGEELLVSKKVYDLIVLDYQMGDLNGLETADLLRRRKCGSSIIFVTAFPQVMRDAFKVSAFRFIDKPLVPDQLNEAFDAYFDQYGFDISFPENIRNQTVCIHTKDVMYLEADNKYCYIHLKDDTLHSLRTMSKVSENFPETHFYKINRAFIVNFNYIERYDKEFVYFKNDERVHISRGYYTSFKKAYNEYICSKKPRNLQPL